MKAWLSQHGVEFVDRNVDEDPTAYDELLARGLRSVPVTVVGASVIVGYLPDQLAEALRTVSDSSSLDGQSNGRGGT